jgi:hypothetical protein
VCDRVLQDELIAGADRKCGKFRTYLLTALDRHVARVRRYDSARKRRPQEAAVETIAHADLPACGTPDSFDIAWARQVIAQAIEQMRKEYNGGRRGQMWEAFELCVLAPLLQGQTPPTHAAAMGQLGLESVQEVSNTLVSGKRAFARTLHAVIGEYATGEQDIEAELRDLWTIVSRSGTGAGHLKRD